MNSVKSIEILYSIIQKKYGDDQARSAVMSIIGNILYDLKEEGLQVSEQNLSKQLDKYVDDFLEASKSDVA